jgi:hypothetical protein
MGGQGQKAEQTVVKEGLDSKTKASETVKAHDVFESTWSEHEKAQKQHEHSDTSKELHDLQDAYKNVLQPGCQVIGYAKEHGQPQVMVTKPGEPGVVYALNGDNLSVQHRYVKQADGTLAETLPDGKNKAGKTEGIPPEHPTSQVTHGANGEVTKVEVAGPPAKTQTVGYDANNNPNDIQTTEGGKPVEYKRDEQGWHKTVDGKTTDVANVEVNQTTGAYTEVQKDGSRTTYQPNGDYIQSDNLNRTTDIHNARGDYHMTYKENSSPPEVAKLTQTTPDGSWQHSWQRQPDGSWKEFDDKADPKHEKPIPSDKTDSALKTDNLKNITIENGNIVGYYSGKTTDNGQPWEGEWKIVTHPDGSRDSSQHKKGDTTGWGKEKWDRYRHEDAPQSASDTTNEKNETATNPENKDGTITHNADGSTDVTTATHMHWHMDYKDGQLTHASVERPYQPSGDNDPHKGATHSRTEYYPDGEHPGVMKSTITYLDDKNQTVGTPVDDPNKYWVSGDKSGAGADGSLMVTMVESSDGGKTFSGSESTWLNPDSSVDRRIPTGQTSGDGSIKYYQQSHFPPDDSYSGTAARPTEVTVVGLDSTGTQTATLGKYTNYSTVDNVYTGAGDDKRYHWNDEQRRLEDGQGNPPG